MTSRLLTPTWTPEARSRAGPFPAATAWCTIISGEKNRPRQNQPNEPPSNPGRFTERDGVIDIVALGLILRTRVDGVSLELAAAEQESTVRQANCIRWRAERRLRPVLALVS